MLSHLSITCPCPISWVQVRHGSIVGRRIARRRAIPTNLSRNLVGESILHADWGRGREEADRCASILFLPAPSAGDSHPLGRRYRVFSQRLRPRPKQRLYGAPRGLRALSVRRHLAMRTAGEGYSRKGGGQAPSTHAPGGTGRLSGREGTVAAEGRVPREACLPHATGSAVSRPTRPASTFAGRARAQASLGGP